MHSLFRRAKAPSAAAGVAPAPMPMLSFPGKKALRFTGDTSAAERDTDLAKLMLARGHVVALSSDSAKKRAATAAEAAAALRAYLRVLYAVEINGSSGQQLLRFAWRDAGSGSGSKDKKVSKASSSSSSSAAVRSNGHASLATEHAVALFALAAELARAAAEEDRRGVDGVRRACAALGDAAGALSAAAAKGRAAPEEGSGLCHMTGACLAALERLMLVQAHECYFELAVAGGKPPALCAKIARQVSLDYHQVSIAIDSLQQQIDKSWAQYVEAKAVYFHAKACHLHARALLEEGAGCVGEAVARLRYALSPAVLDGAGKAAIKKAPAAMCDAAAALRKEVEAQLAAAENDNCHVFVERVPAADALPALPGLEAPLVRPSPEEKVLREPDGEAALARGGAPTARH